MSKPRLLIISHVLPFPGSSGQQRRVLNTLRATAKQFHVTFVTVAAQERIEETRRNLSVLCDESIVLASCYVASRISKIWHSAASVIYAACKGLKRTNYLIGQVELSASRLEAELKANGFDLALFEYWHGVGAARLLKKKRHRVSSISTTCWSITTRPTLPGTRQSRGSGKDGPLPNTNTTEHSAWKAFDGLVIMNHEEEGVVRRVIGEKPLFYAPMGSDLTEWPDRWEPSHPVRVGYYGGLGNRANQNDALTCHSHVMPAVWRSFPAAELVVGGQQPP